MPGPVMPLDVSIDFCMTHSTAFRSFLSSYDECRTRNLVNRCKPLQPCMSFRRSLEAPHQDWKIPKDKCKKRVVFADSKGMSLTAIHVFSQFEEDMLPSKQPFDLKDLESTSLCLKFHMIQSMVLDFPQPDADYLDFRSRLMKNSVCLENCMIQEKSLTGTVKVRNFGFKKSVLVRVTFDSWKSYVDVEGVFMNNVYGCQDTDTFCFEIELLLHGRTEFCVCFKNEGQVYWDNNNGKNYRVIPVEGGTNERDVAFRQE